MALSAHAARRGAVACLSPGRGQGRGGTAVDRGCHILGYTKHLASGDASERGQLTCTWNLSRGAADGLWRLGYAGFSELGTGTVLG